MVKKQRIIYIFAVIAACALIFVLFLVFQRGDDSGGTLPDSAEMTLRETTTVPVEETTPPALIPSATVLPPTAGETAPTATKAPLPSQTAAPSTAAPSAKTYTKGEALSLLSAAVNKTKAYTGAVSAHHTEGFTADIQSITGGSLVASFANRLIGMVVAPVDETLNFSGGSAVNAEGETVPLLLPKSGPFALTESGVVSATATQSGQNTVVDVTLVSESVGMHEIPAANASAIGYLDVGSLDISFLSVQSADITYTGSSIHAVINPEGYVASVTYTIPLYVEGSASAMGISGSAVFTGEETESWTIQWE